MDKMLTVLLSHGYPDFVKVCSDTLIKHNLNVISVFNDGLLLLNRIISDSPDVVLMDEFMIAYNAIDVLLAFQKVKGIRAPIFFVLSSMCDNGSFKKHLEAGADYILPMPFDYNILVDRISIFTGANHEIKTSDVYCAHDRIKKFIHERIAQILNEAGILSNNIGFLYLKESISLTIEDPSLLNPITRKLYLNISKKFKVSQSSVTSAMRYAVKISCLNSDSNFWSYTFKDSVPTLSDFISMVAKTIQNEASNLIINP